MYGVSLEFVSWAHTALADMETFAASIWDHLDRAAESIVASIANGNSRRSRSDRNRFFNVAIGSALECAACLDIGEGRRLISSASRDEGKAILLRIVGMVTKLRDARSAFVQEDSSDYGTPPEQRKVFSHESLDAYRVAVELAVWVGAFLKRSEVGISRGRRLDQASIAPALNIAEGNGRFSNADQIKFLDIAHTAAVSVGTRLDILVATGRATADAVSNGRRIVARLIPLIRGLRNALTAQQG